MIKLIKYELQKKYRMFAAVVVATLLANIFLIVRAGEMGLAILAGLLGVGLLVLYSVDVVKMYSRDINTKTGYMVFMTPNSGYKIIGSKVLTALIQGFIILVFFSAVLILNSTIVYGFSGEIRFFDMDISYLQFISYVAIILVALILYLVQFVMTIYTSITVRKSVLSNIKYKGVISFAIFIAINYITAQIYAGVDHLFNFSQINGVASPAELLQVLLPPMLTATALCAVFILVSGYLLEKKINL